MADTQSSVSVLLKLVHTETHRGGRTSDARQAATSAEPGLIPVLRLADERSRRRGVHSTVAVLSLVLETYTEFTALTVFFVRGFPEN